MDWEEQYDKIYRYCYFKLRRREAAEDVTQETFLRFLDSDGYRDSGRALRYLYTIARNLCVDEYRKHPAEPLPEELAAPDDAQERLITQVTVRAALGELGEEDRELLLLRYVNEVPVSVICRLFDVSRFVIYRRTDGALRQLRQRLRKEDFI